MEAAKGPLRVLLLAALVVMVPIGHAAEAETDLADGWHSWDVEAGAAGAEACCYHVGNAGVHTEGCRMGPGADGLEIDGDCAPASDTLRVYVLVDGGQVKEIRALSAACPVVTSGPVQDRGAMATVESIAWLLRYAGEKRDLGEEAVMAIALHEDSRAFVALKALVEDRGKAMDVRRHALFWLTHTGGDAAFEYLDRLLSAG